MEISLHLVHNLFSLSARTLLQQTRRSMIVYLESLLDAAPEMHMERGEEWGYLSDRNFNHEWLWAVLLEFAY